MTIRSSAWRACAALAALTLTAACAKKDSTNNGGDTGSAAASTSAAGTAPSTAPSTAASGMTQGQQQDVRNAIHDYRLSDDNVNKVIEVTQKMRALQTSNPQLAAAMEQEHGDVNDTKSIDEAASRLDAIPPVKAMLSSAGLSARDYLLTTFTVMEAGAAYQIQKAGKLPPNSELAKDVSPENLAYIGSHQAQLQTLEKANRGSSDGSE